MIRGTTPDYVLTLNGADLTDKTVYVTIAQRSKRITKTGDALTVTTDAEGSIVAFRLTQEDTLSLKEGNAQVQVKYIDRDGYVEGTDIGDLTVDKALLERVIEYAEDQP